MLAPWYAVVIGCVVLLVSFVVAVLCLRWAVCKEPFRFFRRNESRPAKQLPKSILSALTQLEGVTEKRDRRNSQTEAEDAECPICLASLYGSPAGASAPTGAGVDLEAGIDISRTTTTKTMSTSTASTSTTTTAKEERCSLQPVNDEVLKMKRCRHLYHAKCLATWFMRKKYNCPVCRTPYYQPVQRVQPVQELEGNVDYGRGHALPVAMFW
ncbi:Uu.00g006590.m01.CDS01 [Anthostomella pinea]|uniref:Uu.00g006590.m01.CDS01 n=1 Tax=Anthostomella pinea TaxID=933095 RepID=A0AAI8VKD2_9PEZI|nr:Uu.00g006590.m01.CDS01 [Anthostomella pinea]